jgi:hypothetical protein
MATSYLRADSVRANPTSQPVSLALILRICREHDVAPSRFGREALKDPRLVLDMRRGRELRAQTGAKISAYIALLGDR